MSEISYNSSSNKLNETPNHVQSSYSPILLPYLLVSKLHNLCYHKLGNSKSSPSGRRFYLKRISAECTALLKESGKVQRRLLMRNRSAARLAVVRRRPNLEDFYRSKRGCTRPPPLLIYR